MLFFTLKTIFISLLLIALIHYLYSFFRDMLTIPKVKDLVNKPAKRYDEMFDMLNAVQEMPKGMQMHQLKDMQMQNMHELKGMQMQNMHELKDMHELKGMHELKDMHEIKNLYQPQSMQNELNNFLSELKKTDTNIGNSISHSISQGNNISHNISQGNNISNVNFPAANDLSNGAYAAY